MSKTFVLTIDGSEYNVPVECPHRKGWLSRGKVNRTKHGKCFLVCPLHYSTFDLPTGRQVGGPTAHDLAVVQVNSSQAPETECVHPGQPDALKR